MQLIRCTKKLQKEMGLKKAGLHEEEPSSSCLGSWHANLIHIDRRKCVLFVNDRTLFNFIAPDVGRAQIKELDTLFREYLQCVLAEEGVPESAKQQIDAEYSEVAYANTKSKSVLGSMNDIALHYSKNITDRQRVITARVFVIVIVIVTYLFSLAEPRRVFQMGVWCFSGFSALFPLVFAALYWRRLTLAGAYAGILAAMASWGYLFWQSDFAKIPNYSVDITLGGEVYQTMPVATILLCSLLAMVAVSLVTRPPDRKILDQFFPRKEVTQA